MFKKKVADMISSACRHASHLRSKRIAYQNFVSYMSHKKWLVTVAK